jgi:hypothetical protein
MNGRKKMSMNKKKETKTIKKAFFEKRGRRHSNFGESQERVECRKRSCDLNMIGSAADSSMGKVFVTKKNLCWITQRVPLRPSNNSASRSFVGRARSGAPPPIWLPPSSEFLDGRTVSK